MRVAFHDLRTMHSDLRTRYDALVEEHEKLGYQLDEVRVVKDFKPMGEPIRFSLLPQDRHSVVSVVDEKGEGGANHVYAIEMLPRTKSVAALPAQMIKFQKGPVSEAGQNGIHNEDLMTVVIHRLKNFQSGPYSCRENAIALTKMEEALHWLNARTIDREREGVEGTMGFRNSEIRSGGGSPVRSGRPANETPTGTIDPTSGGANYER